MSNIVLLLVIHAHVQCQKHVFESSETLAPGALAI